MLVLCKHGYDDYELGEDERFLDELEQNMDWRHGIDDTESEEDESDEDESEEDMDSNDMFFFYKVSQSYTVAFLS